LNGSAFARWTGGLFSGVYWSMSSIAAFDQWTKRIPPSRMVIRNDFFVEFCRGRNVVHLGACDTPFTQESGPQGRLLHQKLKPVSKSLVGMDFDQTSIDWLRTNLGISDIIQRDLSKSDPSLEPLGDVVLCGDIIEHVNSIGDLMYNCNRLCRENGALIISTINATALRPGLRALFRREAVHPDHVAYFSFSNLGVLCHRFGFEPVDVRYFHYGAVSRWIGIPMGILFRLAPAIADGILVVAKKVRKL
jgi:hypothetical protein